MKKAKLTEPERKALGVKIREFMVKEGFNQSQMAKGLSVSQGSFSEAVTGKYCPLWIIYRILELPKYNHYKEFFFPKKKEK